MADRSAGPALRTIVGAVLMNQIPMDSLMALAEERRNRYTDEAERFRLARLAARALRRGRSTARSGTRVTTTGHRG